MDETSAGPWGGIEAWAISQVKEHPKSTLALVSTLWGGAIVLNHFARIGHLPVLALADLAGVVLASAVVGFAALLAVAILLIAPGLPLLYWYRQGIRPKSVFFCEAVRADDDKGEERTYLALSVAAALLSAASYAAMLFRYDWLLGWLPAFAVPPLLIAAGLETGLRERIIRTLRSRWLFFAFQGLCYLICWAIMTPIVLLWQHESEEVAINNLMILVGMTIFLHLIIFATDKTSIRVRLITPALVVVYLLILTNAPSIGASRVIGLFGLGEVSKVDIVLTKQGCDTVNTAWPRRPCVVTGANSGAYLLADVDLLMRIGPQYVLAQRDGSVSKVDLRAPRVAIRSEDVLGWSKSP